MTSHARPLIALVTLVALLALDVSATAGHVPAQQFNPTPQTTPTYGIAWPAENPATQRFLLPGPDDAPLFVEVALPEPSDGLAIPTILIMTPYGAGWHPLDVENANVRHRHTIEYFVPLGYAVAIGHVPGTGRSGGCWDLNGPNELEATVRIIEFLSDPKQAPWSDGRVGMYGISYDALTQIAVVSRADASRIAGLKAIVPVSGFAGEYDALARDGVQAYPITASYPGVLYNGYYATLPPKEPDWDPFARLQRSHECTASGQQARLDLDLTGSYSSYWEERDARAHVGNVRAATLLTAGAADPFVPIISQVGWFNRVPADIPRSAVISHHIHAFPDAEGGPRPDWTRMVHAWFDEHLMGLDSGTKDWPTVQVSDNEGRWRAVPSWPDQGGPAAQLALAHHGKLGATEPSVATTELLSPGMDGVIGAVSFRTEPLGGPLHVTGLPILDLYVTVTDPDARIGAVLRGYDADGNPVSQPLIHGARHVKYPQAMPDDYFHPDSAVPVTLGQPLRLPIRLSPTDLVVPEGGTLEVTIATSVSQCGEWCTVPSAQPSSITIHHGCDYPSTLLFELPSPGAKLLSFPHAPQSEHRFLTTAADGGGLATQRVCGEKPVPPMETIRS